MLQVALLDTQLPNLLLGGESTTLVAVAVPHGNCEPKGKYLNSL